MAGELQPNQDGERAASRVRKTGRRWLLLGAGAGAIALVAFGLLERRWWTMNDITTGETPEYPDLPSHVYAADRVTVRSAAIAACGALARWRLGIAAGAEMVPPLHVEVRTALFNFTDDVTVVFVPLPEDAGARPRTRVVIRSHSRVGKGDLGENERHIRALQREMDARLPQASDLRETAAR